MKLFDNSSVNRHWRNNLILFICILGLFIIGPAFNLTNAAPFISTVFFTLLVFSSVFVIEYLHIVRKALLINGLILITILWIDYFLPNRIAHVAAFTLLIIFLFAITVSLIIHVAASKDVNANIIFSAINGYLLLGIIGAISLTVLGFLSDMPLLNNFQSNSVDDLIYFSYVTLTTLGYGDITPIAPGARAIAMLLSIIGQLYIAILIAMLVGKYLNSANKNN